MKKFFALAVVAVMGVSWSGLRAQVEVVAPEIEYILADCVEQAMNSPEMEPLEEVVISMEDIVSDLGLSDIEELQGCAPNQVLAGVCSITLGSLGIGNFIVGRVGRGILDILFCETGIPFIVGVVRGIVWLSMSPERWEEKFGCQKQTQTIINNYYNSNVTNTND